MRITMCQNNSYLHFRLYMWQLLFPTWFWPFCLSVGSLSQGQGQGFTSIWCPSGKNSWHLRFVTLKCEILIETLNREFICNKYVELCINHIFWKKLFILLSPGLGGCSSPDFLLGGNGMGRSDHHGQLQQIQQQLLPWRHDCPPDQLWHQCVCRAGHLLCPRIYVTRDGRWHQESCHSGYVQIKSFYCHIYMETEIIITVKHDKNKEQFYVYSEVRFISPNF